MEKIINKLIEYVLIQQKENKTITEFEQLKIKIKAADEQLK